MITKKQRHTLFCILTLAAAALFLCWLFVFRQGIFGSKVDWISQHSVLPDYFRQRFYETKDLFPDFAAGIGGGQNIYNFAYYGLFSPVILLSYLLPFIPMDIYIMGASILSLIASAVLFYLWLSGKFSSSICFSAALIFLLAAPMIYHSYNQLMFVNYMPFLCMALLGVDRYFQKGKWGLMGISAFCMILTSFYFSIGGLLAIVLYGISVYIGLNQTVKLSAFIKDGIKFVYPLILAILISSFFLIPVMMTLKGGRSSNASWTLVSLLTPSLPVMRLLYHPHGIGLTALSVVALCAGFIKKGPSRFLSATLVLVLCIPLFGCILNGGLYLKDKAFIPLLPLICYLIAVYLDGLKKGAVRFKTNLFCFGAAALYILVFYERAGSHGDYGKYILADLAVMLICFLLFMKFRSILVMTVPALCFMLCYGAAMNDKSDMDVSHSLYATVKNPDISDAVNDILKKDKEYYRIDQLGNPDANAANINRIHTSGQLISSVYSSIYNPDYMEFRKNTFELDEPFRNMLMQSSTSNPVFQDFMGIRYIISDDVYKNTDAAPIAYATTQYMSKSQYDRLTFPYNQTALLSYAVLPDKEKDNSTFSLPSMIQTTENGRRVQLKKPRTVEVPIPENMRENDTLFLKFHVTNNKKHKDVAVTVEGQRNKLSAVQHPYYNGNEDFTYAFHIKPGQKTIRAELGTGDYTIEDISVYSCLLKEFKNPSLYQDIFKVTDNKGNRIAGTIDCGNDEYFITSIPYDKGFHVTVDGKTVSYSKVNTAFLGFPISKGSHKVEITYEAPGAKTGRLLSSIGILLCIITILTAKILSLPAGTHRMADKLHTRRQYPH